MQPFPIEHNPPPKRVVMFNKDGETQSFEFDEDVDESWSWVLSVQSIWRAVRVGDELHMIPDGTQWGHS